MKYVVLVIIVPLLFYVAMFHSFPALRDTVRGGRLSGPAADRYRAYTTGKAYVRGNWKGASGADFEAWGDDSGESAIHVNDFVDLAVGHCVASSGGLTSRQQWCTAIERRTGDPIDFAVGEEADAAVDSVAAGTFLTAKKRSSTGRGSVFGS